MTANVAVTSHRYFAESTKEYTALLDGSSVHLLNGRWKLHMSPRPEEVPDGFWQPEYPDSDWASVEVPGNIETQGFGQPHYTNFQYPWAIDPPRVPSHNPTACYRTSFRAPTEWSGRRAFLTFESADSALYCWLDGNFVGYSQDSRLPAEFDITRWVRPGAQHLLAVMVLRWSDGSYLEDQVCSRRDPFASRQPSNRGGVSIRSPYIVGHVVPVRSA